MYYNAYSRGGHNYIYVYRLCQTYSVNSDRVEITPPGILIANTGSIETMPRAEKSIHIRIHTPHVYIANDLYILSVCCSMYRSWLDIAHGRRGWSAIGEKESEEIEREAERIALSPGGRPLERKEGRMEAENATDSGLNGTDASRNSTPIFPIDSNFIEKWYADILYSNGYSFWNNEKFDIEK